MGEIGATEDVASQQPVGTAWRLPARTLGAIASGALAITGLAALAGAVDLSSLNAEPQQGREQVIENGQPVPEPNPGEPRSGSSAGGASAGSPAVDGITLGGDGQVRIEAIPGCPGGISINDEVLVVPDPEACGFRPIEPGETVEDGEGRRLLVPDEEGTIGGVQIGDDGEVQLVPIDEVSDDAIRIDREIDGSITVSGVDEVDGERVRIDVTNEQNFQVTTPDGSTVDAADGENTAEPESGSSDPVREIDDRNPNRSNLALLQALIFLVAISLLLGLCVALVKSISSIRRRGPKPPTLDSPELADPEIGPKIGPDFSNEISAIDRLLWEIDQEKDPRRAIQRVYAAVETGLGNEALARRTAETPGVYLRRVLGRDRTLQPPLETLTSLFEQARFSQHEITPEMRNLAIESLQTIRAQFQILSAKPAAANESGVLV